MPARTAPDHEGSPREQAAELEALRQEVRTLRRRLREAEARAEGALDAGYGPAREVAPPDPGRLADQYEIALLTGQAMTATDILLRGLRTGLDGPTLLSRVVTPAMHAIGAAWERGALSVADEHLATAVSHRAVAGLYPEILNERPRSRERVLVAAIEGERHALAPRLVSDVLEAHGYDVIHLGKDVPTDSLRDSVERFRPALVALSLTMPERQPVLAHAVATLQRATPEVRLLLGGQGVGDGWAEAGFAVTRDLESTPALVERLLAEPADVPLLPLGETTAPSVDDDPSEDLSRVAGELSEIARSHAIEARAYRTLALQDPLTGLANRRAFDDGLVRRAESGLPGAVLLVDVDGFKSVNDRLGHDAGDARLASVARAIAAAVRPDDLVARLGGDEFGVLLVGEPDASAVVAERIRRRVEADCGSTVSIGVAPIRGNGRAAVDAADRALYRAKAAGRNAVRLAPDR